MAHTYMFEKEPNRSFEEQKLWLHNITGVLWFERQEPGLPWAPEEG